MREKEPESEETGTLEKDFLFSSEILEAAKGSGVGCQEVISRLLVRELERGKPVSFVDIGGG